MSFIARSEFIYQVPSSYDPDLADGATENISVSVDSTDCPWLTYNATLKALYVGAGTTTNENVGVCNFKVLVSDNFPYGVNYSIYEAEITVLPANNLPYFDPALPGTIAFTVLEAYEYAFPTIMDDDKEPVTMTVDLNSLTWLNYNDITKELFVRERATGRDESNTHHEIYITLRDTYTLGINEVTFTLKIWVRPPEKPFFVLKPVNTGPVFADDLPQNPVSFNVTEAWEYVLPDIYDFDKDEVFVKAYGTEATYVRAENTPARLMIEAG